MPLLSSLLTLQVSLLGWKFPRALALPFPDRYELPFTNPNKFLVIDKLVAHTTRSLIHLCDFGVLVEAKILLYLYLVLSL